MQIKPSPAQDRPTPLISFIIAYYNLPVDMLIKCIESILTLSLLPEEKEIIVIDDGSDVSPLEQLSRFATDVTYIRQKNGGLSMARNTGLCMATGQYIQFVDADDQLIAHPYEHCLDMARRQSPDMVLFDFTHTALPPASYHDTEAVSGTDYMRHNNLRATAWGYLFRQAILGELRFTPGIYHEDEDFTPRLLLRAETICTTDAKAYLYCKRQDSITTSTDSTQRTKRLDDMKGIITSLNMVADRLPHAGQLALERRVAQLTMDYIYKVIVEKQDRKELERRIGELRSAGLFPLPDRNYTRKYNWFRRISSTTMGRQLLMQMLPLMNRER